MFHEFVSFAQIAMQSDMFVAGVGLGLIGVLLGMSRLCWSRLIGLIKRRFLISVTLDNRTDAYRHFMLWLDDSRVLAKARRVQMSDVQLGKRELLAPAPGTHWFTRAGKLCIFYREINEKTRIGAGHHSRPMETVTLVIPFGTVAMVEDWIAEGRKIGAKRDRIGPGLHVLKGDWWDYMGDVPARPIASVLTDDDRIARLCDDVDRFYASHDWYAQRGVPWRRGYLLYGPPGTGKSSVIRAIASELHRDIATLDIGRRTLSDDDLREAMFDAPAGAIIVIEDIDALFRKRKSKDGGISFSGLLNAIDGLAAQESRALFMTTNHRERLDPALIRPGRADLHVELAAVSAATAKRLFLRFFPGEDLHAAAFERSLGTTRSTPAQLQGWLLEHAEDVAMASTAAGLINRSASIAAE